jgi:hypothetical protein
MYVFFFGLRFRFKVEVVHGEVPGCLREAGGSDVAGESHAASGTGIRYSLVVGL